MTLLEEAVARYHKLLETEGYRDASWAEAIRARMSEMNLAPGGRPVCPVLRPHLISRRQYVGLVKAAEALYSAIERVKQMALSTPSLLARMELLPAEKMLASVDPGYPYMAVTSLLDTQLQNGSLRFVECYTDGPAEVAYCEALAEIFYECRPVKELRKRYKLSRMGGAKRLLAALLEAYGATGKKKYPCIGIVEYRQQFQSAPAPEFVLLAEFFRRSGYPTEVLSPEQLEYRNGVLSRGDFAIDIVYRRISAQELLFRFDLNHPLVRAYREGAICMVNSFRAELAQKKAIFDLLTDETVTAGFPATERKAIQDFIPWTRLVAATKTKYKNKTVDLPEFILSHREKLVMKPNDAGTEYHAYRGWELDSTAWQRALRSALRHPYVVQERVEPTRVVFPIYQFGRIEMREMRVDLHPHIYLGKVEGCSSQVSDATSGFSLLSGLAPTFILEGQT